MQALCQTSSLVTWMVVSLTSAKFKPPTEVASKYLFMMPWQLGFNTASFCIQYFQNSSTGVSIILVYTQVHCFFWWFTYLKLGSNLTDTPSTKRELAMNTLHKVKSVNTTVCNTCFIQITNSNKDLLSIHWPASLALVCKVVHCNLSPSVSQLAGYISAGLHQSSHSWLQTPWDPQQRFSPRQVHICITAISELSLYNLNMDPTENNISNIFSVIAAIT
jgi:hypothetical protein